MAEASETIRDRLRRDLNQADGRVIGDVVMWNSRAIHAMRADVDKLLHDLGLADDIKLKSPAPVTCFRRAVISARRGPEARDYVLEKLGEDDDEIAVAVLSKETIDRIEGTENCESELARTKDLKFQSEFVATFKRAVAEAHPLAFSSELLVIDPPTVRHPIADKMVMEFRRLRDRYTAVDISRAFIETFDKKWSGIRLKLDGGAWFIPADLSDKVAAWRYLMAKIKAHPVVLPQFDAGDTVSGIAEAAADDLLSQVDEMRQEIEEMTDKTRIGTMESLAEVHSRIKAKANMVKRILGKEIGSIDKLLDEADDALMERMNARRKPERKGTK